MRRSILSLVILMLLASCASYNRATNLSNKAYIGMPLKEFLSLAGKGATLDLLQEGVKAYRVNDYDAWSGAITNTKFFYFDSEEKLFRVDSGVRK